MQAWRGGQTQEVPQGAPRWQNGRQTPLTHPPGGQLWPHSPQLVASLFTSLQSPLQHILLVPGVLLQILPHAPQFEGVFSCRHFPLQHAEPAKQTAPQPPQLKSSVLVLTQTSPQRSGWSAGHWHRPEMQTPPIKWHWLPHAPQLNLSVLRLTQTVV